MAAGTPMRYKLLSSPQSGGQAVYNHKLQECIDIKKGEQNSWNECGVVIVGIIPTENEAAIVHILCLQNDSEISNEALKRKEWIAEEKKLQGNSTAT